MRLTKSCVLLRGLGRLLSAALIACSTSAIAEAPVQPASQAPIGASLGGNSRDIAPDRPMVLADTSRCVASRLIETGVTILSAEMVETGGALRCRIIGRVATNGEGAGPGNATFELNLPARWNSGFLFNGGAGLDGAIPPAQPAYLGRGYVIVGTDSGHTASPDYPNPGADASWVLGPDGKRDDAKLADYYYRARHQVNEKVRPLVERYYGSEVKQAIFMGCSGGGREALIEAERNSSDYDGYISGNAWINVMTGVQFIHNVKTFLKAPIPYAKLPAVQAAIQASCDATDGVKDGLIQNPAACSFDPKSLVDSGVLSDAQAEALRAYLRGTRDEAGNVVTYGGALTGLGDLSLALPRLAGHLTGIATNMTDPQPQATTSQPWGELVKSPINWLMGTAMIAGLTYNDLSKNMLDPAIVDDHGVVSAKTLRDTRAALKDAVVHADGLGTFLATNRKLLMYHSYSDSLLSAYDAEALYESLRKAAPNNEGLAKNVRLFVVPEMQHCGGGIGPNVFDPVSVMEGWLASGTPPDRIVATKFAGNNPLGSVERTMPVCAYPGKAVYKGSGDLKIAANWTCGTADKLGKNGKQAGITWR